MTNHTPHPPLQIQNRRWHIIRCVHVMCDTNCVFLRFDSVYWSIGLYASLVCIKIGATRIIISKTYYPDLQLKLVQKYKVTYLWCGQFRLVACLKSELISDANQSSVLQIRSYGSKMLSSIVTEIIRYFPNAKTNTWYGMSEIGAVA